MNAIIEQIYSSGVVEDADHNQYPHDTSSVFYTSGAILYHLIRDFNLSKTLEVGFAYGLSTLFICQGLADNGQGSHIAIDPYQERKFRSIGLLNIERASLSQFLQFYPQPSYQALAELNAQKASFDFAFVDGSHLFDFIMVDFFFIDRMLTRNGFIVFDDLWLPSVRKVVSFALHNRAYRLIKPSRKIKTSWSSRLGFIGKRFLQNPLGRDWPVKWIPYNVVILQKIDDDKRKWTFYRDF